MNTNSLTIKAQQALQGAVAIAQKHSEQAVEPIHILSALIEDEQSLTTFLLGRVGVNIQTLRKDVTEAVSRLPKVSGTTDNFFSNNSTRVIQRAVDFTKKFNDKYASVEHLRLVSHFRYIAHRRSHPA